MSVHRAATPAASQSPARLVSAERRAASRAGALKSWGLTEDRTKRTAPGRAGLRKSIEAQVPDHITGTARQQAADALWRAHFAELTRRSVARRRAAMDLLRAAEANGEMTA